MPDFLQGKIYKLFDNTNSNAYIGSTTMTLKQRLKKHERDYVNFLNGKYGSMTSFEIIKNNNYSISLLENFPCNSKIELFKKEGEYILKEKCLNKRIMGRSHKEYTEQNKDKIKELQKKYQETNKDKICEQNRKYREENKDKIRDKKKEYYETNHDEILKKRREYGVANKGKILAYVKEYNKKNKIEISNKKKQIRENSPVIICECGASIKECNIRNHIKTKKHIKFISLLSG